MIEESGNPSALAPPDRARPKRLLAESLFFLLLAETIFSVPYRSVFLATGSRAFSWIAALGFCALIGLCYPHRNTILAPLRRLAVRTATMEQSWFILWWLFGLALRIAWAETFRVTLKSDAVAYFDIAKSLAAHHPYVKDGLPPGFSFFLAPFFMLFGAHIWVTVLCALLLFTATYWLTYRLAERLQPGATSRIAAMLIAVWPSYIAVTGVNAKETLLAPLIVASLYLYLRAAEAAPAASRALLTASGILTGFAALAQPAFILFPAIILLAELLRSTPLRAAARTVIFSLAMLAAILPWSVRNYTVLHRFVLISTNGGSVFYRANNPLANAGYSPQGEEPLPEEDFAEDREGYKAAEAWILHQPGAFAILMVRKQVLYLGDDGVGVYESMKRDLQPPARLYAPAKAICNLFWIAAWILLLLGLPELFRSRRWPLWYGICVLPLLYQWAIDSVFESGARHHLPYLGLLAILVGILLSPAPTANASLIDG